MVNGGMIEFNEISRQPIYVLISYVIGLTWAHSSVQEFVRHPPVRTTIFKGAHLLDAQFHFAVMLPN